MSKQFAVLFFASIAAVVVVLASIAALLVTRRKRRREAVTRARLSTAEVSNGDVKTSSEGWPPDTRTVCSGGDEEDLHLAHMPFDDVSLFDQATQVD
jgi:hypothetical protein